MGHLAQCSSSESAEEEVRRDLAQTSTRSSTAGLTEFELRLHSMGLSLVDNGQLDKPPTELAFAQFEGVYLQLGSLGNQLTYDPPNLESWLRFNVPFQGIICKMY